eukprot:SAG31_NODE_1740_length_7394_cov_7.518849_3_plen_174_part_00
MWAVHDKVIVMYLLLLIYMLPVATAMESLPGAAVGASTAAAIGMGVIVATTIITDVGGLTATTTNEPASEANAPREAMVAAMEETIATLEGTIAALDTMETEAKRQREMDVELEHVGEQVRSDPILSNPILSYPILSYPILSYLILSTIGSPSSSILPTRPHCGWEPTLSQST